MATDGASAQDGGLEELVDADIDRERLPVDRYWLGVGLRLGLERPDRATSLLRRLEAARSAEPEESRAGGSEERRSAACADLVRSAAAWRATSGASPARFDWVRLLTRGDVVSIGQAVGAMLESEAGDDLARGFGLAWDGGHRLPIRDQRTLFAAFVTLEGEVAAALAGHELAEDRPLPSSGLAAALGSLLFRTDPATSEIAHVLERSGEPGKRGLVGIWNAWSATCFRDALPAELRERLVGAWVAVVGPLPDV